MGVLFCDCSATASQTGTQTVTLLGFPVTLSYDVDISICPECLVGGSFVNASFSATIPIIGAFTASFESTSVGFPVCTVENGVQTLEVEVEGNLTIGGGDPDPASFTLTLVSTGQVCIDLMIANIQLPCLDIPVVFTSCD